MKTNAGNHASGQADEPRRAKRAKAPAWSQPQEALQAVLGRHRVPMDVIDGRTGRFKAVPVGAEFNKEKTNLLLHKIIRKKPGAFVFVDIDLKYQGTDPALVRAFGGACCKDWRRLAIPPVPGDIDQAFYTVLELLDSPIAEEVRSALQLDPDSGRDGADSGLGPVLTEVGEVIEPEAAARAYEKTLRKELAEELALIATRPEGPNSVVVWGPAGVGKDLLLLAATHPLLKGGRVSRVVQVSGGRVGVGSIFQAEMDASLLRTLAEAAEQEECVFLIRDLDVCVSGSAVSRSVLCEAIDRGVRLLATVRSEAALGRLGADEGLARRIVAVPLGPPPRCDVEEALGRIAKASPVEVRPAALHAVRRLARDVEGCGQEPALSISLLTAAICRASWKGSQVDPDMVCSVRRSEWPEDLKELPHGTDKNDG